MNSIKPTIAFPGCLLAAALAAAPAAAAQDRPPGERPRIGLVLAGSGAKGGAHVGALKVLEEMRVPIDCIAGTSIGALVGAGYATGQPAAEIEKFVTGIDWAAVIGGVGRRKLEPIEQKRLTLDAGSNVRMGVIEGKIVTPSGDSPTPARSTTCCAATSPARAPCPTSTGCRSRTVPSRPTC
mgnify:FL=1|jgi:NTE family protein